MYDQISIDQYQGVHGFGPPQSRENVMQLVKALEAGYEIVNQTGGAALRVQSMESSMKVATFTSRHFAFWKKLHKSPAFNTVEEYNRLNSYGAGSGGWVREGELAEATDSNYTRETALIKYLSTQRQVSLQASMINPAHGDVISQENHNGIMFLLEKIEKGLFTGDGSLAYTPPGSTPRGEEFDGLQKQIDPANVIDLEGNPLSESVMQEASDIVAESGYGYATDLLAGVRPLGDLVRSFYARERVALPAPVNGQIGNSVSTILTQNGVVQVNSDIFLKKDVKPPAIADSARAPASASALDPIATGISGTDGDFPKSQGSTDVRYAYCVCAANRFGQSAPTFISAPIDMSGVDAAAGKHVDIRMTNGAPGVDLVDYYNVYRTEALGAAAAVPTNVNQYSLITRIPTSSQAGAATTDYADVNFKMPFTSEAFVGQLTPDVLTFRQLAPLMRLDLAVTTPARRWIVLIFGAPILFIPRRWCRIVNIGTLA